ncbi:succinyldiaminopimelate aminotransferase apoenzyme [Andreprevotia lacus DSM 23236]|jgi:N-succinyldiaminopimelate aminotransferase|uniref:Putative 8-amino-7-oxononanoate synthase n=1 Tax=Andreprevotia lacus DSM 23236 TaxID=1121001 RepID=A0A1W1XN85_9NEIS|nr:succinyldiaminopimelate transaminase [Andreprevotia lacus]SMC25322.1 succinyldiaminopimelate aminotransferase apoenzyme [Andreprevotia lacus DSM 23236]
MSPRLQALQPYPFQKLRALFAGVTPNPALAHVNLSIGEPKHPTPQLVKDALVAHFDGLAAYPATLGSDALRGSIAAWAERRYALKLNPAKEIIPVNGSREALFSFAQTVIDASGDSKPVVISPNPFYQIYEGAALLAGAEPYYVNCLAAKRFQPDWANVPEDVWARTQLVFVCSPGNPTGAVASLDDWRELFALSDRYGFVIASDECYSEIYFNDAKPLGGLEAAKLLGRDFSRLVIFSSLSKRSNVPGMRSGFVAGDAAILEQFLLYRTYHGCAMSPSVQAASAAAWDDEAHVLDNRVQYTAKFNAVTQRLQTVLDVNLPDASFYLWAKVPAHVAGGDDAEFARRLYAEQHVTVLPGSYLAREAHGVNPGAGYVRIALVAPLAECVEAAERIVRFCQPA